MEIIALILLSFAYLVSCTNPYYIPNIKVRYNCLMRRINFDLHNLQANWHQAFDHCKFNGMELVTIANHQEYNQLTAHVAQELNCTQICAVWIGANDLANEGTFTWASTGRRVAFTNWKSNQPDNKNDDLEEDCVEVLHHPEGNFMWQWNDSVCTHEKFFVCEKVNTCIQEFN